VCNKWVVNGLAVMLGASLAVPAEAFFNPGRWMDPSEWFGNNNRNYGPPPPRPVPAQTYPPAYTQPTPYTYPAPAVPAPAPVAPIVTAPAAAPTMATPSPATVPSPTAYPNPSAPIKYEESNPVYPPSTSNSGLEWPDEKFVIDNPQSDQNFSFAPSGYLQGSDKTK